MFVESEDRNIDTILHDLLLKEITEYLVYQTELCCDDLTMVDFTELRKQVLNVLKNYEIKEINDIK